MLEAKNIHKVYHNGKKELAVLKGIDLKIAKGDFAAIVGPSGAGKSTLLHILGGLDLPSQGEVIFQEENIYKLKDSLLSRIRNKKIGFVFQFYHLLSEFTVLENVLMPALISREPGVRNPQTKEKALKLLDRAGLSERAQHFPNQLSGGEKQRVAIARSLINRPQLLLCDEPTGNLDSRTGDEIISLIKQINKGEEMSVLLVTHNQALAEAADKIYHLRDGILVN
ncbi:MAG: ABC transporter ATP-binding protein [Candidatus Omnitrophica bacterium]|nr:ABC transporter ATP-binding protein [Candidatus Omnitrophota bacterium]MBL7210325.1 ABC transporter ATP-binding protein [Candidatus Omnitrophota bacterium]